MEEKDIFDKLFHLRCLRWFEGFFVKHRQGVLYIFFGGLTTLVNLVCSAIFWYVLGWKEWYVTLFGEKVAIGTFLGNLISIALSILFAYVTNRKWVFTEHARGLRGVWNEFLRFIGGRIVTLILELGLVQMATILFPDNGVLLFVSKLIAMVLVILINFLFSKFLVFKDEKKS